jgi:hypothetical protein
MSPLPLPMRRGMTASAASIMLTMPVGLTAQRLIRHLEQAGVVLMRGTDNGRHAVVATSIGDS